MLCDGRATYTQLVVPSAVGGAPRLGYLTSAVPVAPRRGGPHCRARLAEMSARGAVLTGEDSEEEVESGSEDELCECVSAVGT